MINGTQLIASLGAEGNTSLFLSLILLFPLFLTIYSLFQINEDVYRILKFFINRSRRRSRKSMTVVVLRRE